MAKKSEESAFGGFFIWVGAVGGALAGAGAADQAGDELWPAIFGGLIAGLIIGAIVEYVLNVVWKILLVLVTIFFLFLRIQACGAFREGLREGMEESRSSIELSHSQDVARVNSDSSR